MENYIKKRVAEIIKKNSLGVSITDLVNLTQFSRSAVRIALAMLEGANEISFRQIGMTKLYFLNKIEKNSERSGE